MMSIYIDRRSSRQNEAPAIGSRNSIRTYGLLILMTVASLALFAGCASEEYYTEPPLEAQIPQEPKREPIVIARTMDVQENIPDMITIPFWYQHARLGKKGRRMVDGYINSIENANRLNYIVEGYTCTEGDPEYNVLLSKWRAETVKRYMVKKGISRYKITVIGHGGKNPIASNRRQAGRIKNRRVTITATKPY